MALMICKVRGNLGLVDSFKDLEQGMMYRACFQHTNKHCITYISYFANQKQSDHKFFWTRGRTKSSWVKVSENNSSWSGASLTVRVFILTIYLHHVLWDHAHLLFTGRM